MFKFATQSPKFASFSIIGIFIHLVAKTCILGGLCAFFRYASAVLIAKIEFNCRFNSKFFNFTGRRGTSLIYKGLSTISRFAVFGKYRCNSLQINDMQQYSLFFVLLWCFQKEQANHFPEYKPVFPAVAPAAFLLLSNAVSFSSVGFSS